jgi:hypothetical protein
MATVKKIKKVQDGDKIRQQSVSALKEMANRKSEKDALSKSLDSQSKSLLDKYNFRMQQSSDTSAAKKPMKSGGMLKRADGSYSKRGLWDNLRSKAAQNKKTGAKPKAPTKAMLSQEKKIRLQSKKKK